MKPFKILKKERVIWERFYKLEKHFIELHNGKEAIWFRKINEDAVILVPMDKEGRVLMQKTYKHGCGEILVESCAGLVDPGESWEEASPRELREETGYVAENFIKLGEVFSNPTTSPMKHHIVLAEGITLAGETEPEDEEQIEPFWVENIQAALDYTMSGQYTVAGATVSALGMTQRHLTK